MTDALRARLERGVEALALTVEPAGIDALQALAGKLQHWSKRLNLTSIRSPEAIVDLHLLDSLALAPWLAGERIADIGTGAGFPGLPLAIVRPNAHFELIDAASRKIRFVVQAAAELGLANVAGIHARLPGYQPAMPFSTITARAYASLTSIVRDCEHILADGGRILAMKGRSPVDELAELDPSWQAEVIRLEVPGLTAERHVVVIDRRR